MKRVIFILFAFSQVTISAQDVADFANPLIGTKGLFLYGRTTPFVTPPFGMTQWTACTRNSRIRIPNYHFFDTRLRGFRGSHKPAMWMGDYGYVTLKPFIGNMPKKGMEQTYFFSHCTERSKPYSYSNTAITPNLLSIKTALTATERCAVMQFEFPKHKQSGVLIEASQAPDFDGWINIIPEKNEIIGWNSDRHSWKLGPPLPNFKGYFVIRFDESFANFGTWVNDSFIPQNTEQKANACGAWVYFNANIRKATARIGTSFISIDQARENLDKEIGVQSFVTTVQNTKQVWNQFLSRIELEGATKRQKHIFYSALYHSLLFPRQFDEYGRYYSAFDDTIHKGFSYNDYSLWDTYRAEHPLLILVAPEHAGKMVQSLIQMYQEGGYMPKWPNPTYTGIMIGTHADAVVADAVAKGIKGFDIEQAFQACRKDAMVPSIGDSINRWADRAPFNGIEARAGLSWYMKLGYVPVDKTNESVSNTLEGAYDDFCVAQVAKAAGHTADFENLMQRSKNYRNVYNQATGMMAPRNADGTWCANTHAGFTEGSPWTYLFGVQHDIPGLIDLMGGKEMFIKKLDANFRGWHYIHMNEPGHHYTYLYDYVGQAWKTQRLVALCRTVFYRNNPDGMDGDDDCGQMSAWYVFSALGFYPVTPGTDVYAIGTPQFPKATLFPNPEDRTKKFEIIAHHVSGINKYIKSVKLNGVKLKEPFIHHADIVNGGVLEFEMRAKPNKKDW